MREFNMLADLVGLCVECRKEIKPEDKTIMLYEDDDAECIVHEGECYSKFLTDPTNVARKCIIGLCEGCVRPVRWNDKIVFIRHGDGHASCDTIIPQKKDIGFMHAKCADELYG